MQVLAQGYMSGAIELIQSCLKDNSDRKADVLIYPIFFAMNQGIELYEKSICWSLNILLGHKKFYPQNHNIRDIWYIDKEKIKKYGFNEHEGRGEKEFYSMSEVLEKYLNDLYKKIALDDSISNAFYNIDFCRYPLNKKNNMHFYVKESGNVVVDLEVYLYVIKDISECLYRYKLYN